MVLKRLPVKSQCSRSSVRSPIGQPITSVITFKLMVLVVMVGNGVPGVIFGWLFRRFGLITAMVAHFSADVILHVIGPMIG